MNDKLDTWTTYLGAAALSLQSEQIHLDQNWDVPSPI